MKKLTIAALLALTTMSVQANNFFVQADMGTSRINTKLGDVSSLELTNKNTASARLTLGYETDNRIYALDYTHFNKVKDSINENYVSAENEAKGFSVGLQGRYKTQFGRFEPYAGARAFYTKLDYSYSNVSTQTTLFSTQKFSVSESESIKSYGAGLMLGTNFHITNNIGLHLGAEYNFPFSSDEKISIFTVQGGIRFTF